MQNSYNIYNCKLCQPYPLLHKLKNNKFKYLHIPKQNLSF